MVAIRKIIDIYVSFFCALNKYLNAKDQIWKIIKKKISLVSNNSKRLAKEFLEWTFLNLSAFFKKNKTFYQQNIYRTKML